MNGNDLLRHMDDLIDIHAKLGVNIHQSGYKEDYFRLFKVAHDNHWFESSAHPRLTGDAIQGCFHERWHGAETEQTKKKGEYLKDLVRMWDEWQYALERIGK